MNGNQECFPRSNKRHIIWEFSYTFIGVSTLVRKFGQQHPTVGTIIRLVSFLSKITLANFNYGNCGYIYSMNLHSPNTDFHISRQNQTKTKQEKQQNKQTISFQKLYCRQIFQ